MYFKWVHISFSELEKLTTTNRRTRVKNEKLRNKRAIRPRSATWENSMNCQTNYDTWQSDSEDWALKIDLWLQTQWMDCKSYSDCQSITPSQERICQVYFSQDYLSLPIRSCSIFFSTEHNQGKWRHDFVLDVVVVDLIVVKSLSIVKCTVATMQNPY